MSRLTFGSFTLEPELRQLTRTLGDEETCVRLSGAEVAILEQLLGNEGVLQGKDELLSIGWSGRPVSPNSLPVAIANLRRHLQGSPPELEIRTLPREGYLLKLASGLQIEKYLDEPALPQQVEQNDVVPSDETGTAIDADALSVDTLPASGPVAAMRQRFRYQRLVRLNLICLVAVVVFALVTAHEWVPVDCSPQSRGTLCVVLDDERDATALELPTDAAQRLIVISGNAWMTLYRGVPSRDRPVSEPARGL
ncbi:MAG: winged helix-turn-helix domain-containing protein [Rhodocyclaceae bacterium]